MFVIGNSVEQNFHVRHYIRTKDGAEVDFALSNDKDLTHLIECKLSDNIPHRTLGGFAGARIARYLPAVWLKRIVIGVGTVMTVIYFFKT